MELSEALDTVLKAAESHNDLLKREINDLAGLVEARDQCQKWAEEAKRTDEAVRVVREHRKTWKVADSNKT